jgi:hypothetical protein
MPRRCWTETGLKLSFWKPQRIGNEKRPFRILAEYLRWDAQAPFRTSSKSIHDRSGLAVDVLMKSLMKHPSALLPNRSARSGARLGAGPISRSSASSAKRMRELRRTRGNCSWPDNCVVLRREMAPAGSSSRVARTPSRRDRRGLCAGVPMPGRRLPEHLRKPRQHQNRHHIHNDRNDRHHDNAQMGDVGLLFSSISDAKHCNLIATPDNVENVHPRCVRHTPA